jgi:branched-chain amino acid aminotransferase
MRTYSGKPYLINEHVERLIRSAAEIGLKLPWTKAQIIQWVLNTLAKNHLKGEANIRIVITGGSSTDFFYPQGSPRLIILITDMNKLPDTWYTKGVKVITHPMERSLPDAKVTAYIPAAMALQKAKEKQAVEAIYVNREDQVLEGTTSNLFAVIDNTLITPKDGVLKGITRQAVIKLAKGFCRINEKPITIKELLSADEIFITGTNKAVVPVVQVDDTLIGSGLPGKRTRQVINALELYSKEFT